MWIMVKVSSFYSSSTFVATNPIMFIILKEVFGEDCWMFYAFIL